MTLHRLAAGQTLKSKACIFFTVLVNSLVHNNEYHLRNQLWILQAPGVCEFTTAYVRLDVKRLAVAVRAEPAPSPKPRLSIRCNPVEEARCLPFVVSILCVNQLFSRFLRPSEDKVSKSSN